MLIEERSSTGGRRPASGNMVVGTSAAINSTPFAESNPSSCLGSFAEPETAQTQNGCHLSLTAMIVVERP